MIGKFTGMAMMIVGMPLIVVGSINILLIPDLSQSISKGNYYDAGVRIKKVMKIAFLLGLATTTICLLIPDALGEMLYQRDDLGNYIKYGALSAPVFFTSVTMFGILNGINKQGIILRNSLIVAVLELIGLFLFTSIPSINIYGYTITLFLTSIISLALNLYEVKKSIDLNLSITNVIIYCLLCGVILLFFSLLIKNVIGPLNVFKNILIILITFGLFTFLGTFGEEEY